MEAKLMGRLEMLVASHEYLAQRAREELDRLNATPAPDDFETMRAQAFIHAHVGMNDLAAQQLNALASDPRGQRPEILNKLAQVKLRRLQPGDAQAAHAAAKKVIELGSADSGELWLAHQNIALAELAQGNIADAETHAAEALRFVDDPRTHELISAIHARREDAVPYVSAMEPMM